MLRHDTYKLNLGCLVLQVPEFKGLPANTVESLAHVLTEKVFPPKGVIYYHGQEVEDVFIVQTGNVKVCSLCK